MPTLRLLAAVIFPLAVSAQSIQPEVLFQFQRPPAHPVSGLTMGPDGSLYGTSREGGAKEWGTVFRVSTNGTWKVLVSFDGVNGFSPEGELLLNSNGVFYGTTFSGATSQGSVFTVTTNGILTTIAAFNGTNGSGPVGPLILGGDGALYGTTLSGGDDNSGTVFRMTPAGVLTTAVRFNFANGSSPHSGLTLGNDGNFYGTTEGGGIDGKGTVFKLTPGGVLTTLVAFNGVNGYGPNGLVRGPNGDFYSTTQLGGQANQGTIFRVTTNGVLTTLTHFFGTNGAYPNGLTLGSDGNFRGTTDGGGRYGVGTVFRVTAGGALTVLHSFNTVDGASPRKPPTQGPDGSFYGTTYSGGTVMLQSGGSYGTVFKLSTSGLVTTLATLAYQNGAYPAAGLMLHRDGHFYGSTLEGGVPGYGALFRFTTNGDVTRLFWFNGANGARPSVNLVSGHDGLLYGTTAGGGGDAFGRGTAFKVTTNGVLTTLKLFTNGFGDQIAPICLGDNGTFYGTKSGDSSIFNLTSNGVLSTLGVLNGAFGSTPLSGLISGGDGNYYGTTSMGGGGNAGTVFRMTPAGTLALLATFYRTNGADARGALVRGRDGVFYGTTYGGGNRLAGTVYKVTPSGTVSTLASFNTTNGTGPMAGLTIGADGNFYGTTSGGGSAIQGTVFQITPEGSLATVCSFRGTNGANPSGALSVDVAGNLYGTTQNGGSDNVGTIFRISVPPAPRFLGQPQPAVQTVAAGTAVTLSANVFGAGPLSFQWTHNGADLPNGTNASLALSNVDLSISGNYAVRVSNSFGVALSSNAIVGVVPAFVVTRAATTITTASALLNGSVTIGSFETLAWFDWGADTNYGQRLEFAAIPGTNGSVTFSNTLAGLEPNTAYHFRAAASNLFGVAYGSNQVFATAYLTNSPPVVRYVNLNNSTPVSPYTNWARAATTIQQAIDVAAPGDTIVVTNGVYDSGGQAVSGSLTNRIALTKAVTVRSVNGPTVTLIKGRQAPGVTNGDGAVRCAYLTNGATLIGFTLTNGGTLGASATLVEQRAGGALGLSPTAMMSNCVITGSSAASDGGGAYGGTLRYCTLTTNWARVGGGVSFAALDHCSLVGNWAQGGGGAANSALTNCILSGNSATGTELSSGGGAYSCTLVNCALDGNSASLGGGASGGLLVNCTVTGNAASYGGGTIYGALRNCLVMYNTTMRSGMNVHRPDQVDFTCTTPVPLMGLGNIGTDPQMASTSHLSANSPCRGAGNASYAGGLDLDNELWAGTPSIGCDEFFEGNHSGPLAVGIESAYTNVAIGFAVEWRARIGGQVKASRWEFGDGTVVSNQPYSAHSWSAPGIYDVTLRAYNDDHPAGVSAMVRVHVSAPVHYVAAGSRTPVPPFTSWATAATDIQQAIDAASVPGALIVVSNGIYRSGARLVNGQMSNRVAVTKPVAIRSVNGPRFTIIEGQRLNNGGAIRCVYLAGGASLDGFTLTQGEAMGADFYRDQSGGGAWCESTRAVISNCVLIGNTAQYYGGGAFNGALLECTVTNNTAQNGGGVAFGALMRCALLGNTAVGSGGGTIDGRVEECVLAANRAQIGGGALGGYLYRCSFTRNEGYNAGGGVGGDGHFRATVIECTLANNSAPLGGAAVESDLQDSDLVANSGTRGGGVANCILTRCFMLGNSAANSGGGGYHSDFYGCVLADNRATLNGGGAEDCYLLNCNVTRNTANLAGGVYLSTSINSVLYNNLDANGAPNYWESDVHYSCTTPLPAAGLGNIAASPQLIGLSHLQPNSPCRGAGYAAFPSDVDFDGDPWMNPPSIGCDEPNDATVFDPPTVVIETNGGNTSIGVPVDFRARFGGRVTSSQWEFGDQTVERDTPYVAHAWTTAGVYALVLRAYNESYPQGISATTIVHVAQQTIRAPVAQLEMLTSPPNGPVLCYANLVRGRDGLLYGTSSSGGVNDLGTVYRVDRSGSVTTLLSFNGSNGARPMASLLVGDDGQLYGTTEQGGASVQSPSDPGYGTLFRLTTNGILTTLFTFMDGGVFLDGNRPRGRLVRGPDGAFYGTTSGGGRLNNSGTVFRFTTDGILSTLVRFDNLDNGFDPRDLTLGPDGKFYGALSYLGGTISGLGRLFALSLSGDLTVLLNPETLPVLNAMGAMAVGSDGMLYGTAFGAPDFGYMGGVFRLTTNGTLTALASFNLVDGAGPASGLTFGPDGWLYGTTTRGGPGRLGTVFRVNTNGVWETIATFDEITGGAPNAGLTLGSDGDFYGTITQPGTSGLGPVFRLRLPVLNAATIDAGEWLATGAYRLRLAAPAGSRFDVLASTNLIQWTQLGSAAESSPGQFEFLDVEAVTLPTRFYKLQSR